MAHSPCSMRRSNVSRWPRRSCINVCAKHSDGLARTAAERVVEVLLDEPRCPAGVSRCQRVADSVVDQTVLLTPAGGSAMQIRYLSRLGLLQLRAEEIGEEVMEAIPAALLVERDEEQVGALKAFQRVLPIVAAGDGVAQWTAEPFQDRGLEQERPQPLRLIL